MEFAVDPLFKKASADFDEGGAKGLLLNHLMIDSQGRIVFDSSDDLGDQSTRKQKRDAEEQQEEDEDETATGERSALEQTPEPEEEEQEPVEIDLASLAARFVPDLGRLDDLDVCPSLKTFELGDPSGSLDIPFLKAPEDRQDQDKSSGAFGDTSGMLIDDDPVGFDDDDLGLGAFDIGGDVGFGEGGQAWAREAALEPQMRVFDTARADGGEDGEGGEGFDDAGDYVVTMNNAQKAGGSHEDILSYFDHALQKNWSSAEHWRIRKIKDVNKPADATKRPRKEKEPFEIDFSSPLDPAVADVVFTQAASNAAISLPKKDWKSKTRNLLPDDKHFSSRELLSLFLKPKARMNRRRVFARGGGIFGSGPQEDKEVPEGEMDEAFWAQRKDPAQGGEGEDTAMPQGDYDANFFQDDGLPFAGGMDDDDDDLEFADAREHFSPGAELAPGMTDGIGLTAALGGEAGGTMAGPFGTTLVTATRRVRPEYVQYARVAKKVDVRRLKEELWKGMPFEGLEKVRPPHIPSHPVSMSPGRNEIANPHPQDPDSSRLLTPPPASAEPPADNDPTLKFTEVMNGLQSVYPKQALDDISTSFCFICLLHLANEKGLEISEAPDLTELTIKRDWKAELEAE